MKRNFQDTSTATSTHTWRSRTGGF